ncbi:hypothetical protein V3C99_007806 [Haemonchus contortus]
MGYEVNFVPPKCTITTSGGKAKHTMTNYCDVNLAYKMVLPSGSKYSIDPATMAGVLEVGKSIEVVITRQAGKGPEENLTIEYNATDPSKGITGKTIVKLKPTE